jgi:hypothetical protein
MALGLVVSLACSSPAFAQVASNTANTASTAAWRTATFVPAAAQTVPMGGRGFTVMVNLGFGIQRDQFVEQTAYGLAGANVGIGAFVTDKIAILGRFSGTHATYDFFDQTSGVVGGTVQYWVSPRVAIEGGAGLGYWSDSFGDSDIGPGLILGASFVVFSKGNHMVLAGAEYSPTFAPDETVHNFGITVGYQFKRGR